MRDGNVFNKTRALPRMSWSPHNLFNLWQRTLGPLQRENSFTRSADSLFQQRWKAKRLVRGYHGDYIGETKFKRWFLPASLPDVRTRRESYIQSKKEDAAVKQVQRQKAVSHEASRRRRQEEEETAPVGSLFLSEVERRLDVVIFRSCLAASVYQARHMVIRGRVMLNGEKYDNPNTRMEPGDLVSVDPEAIPFIQKDALNDVFTYGSVVRARSQVPEPTKETTSESENAESAVTPDPNAPPSDKGDVAAEPESAATTEDEPTTAPPSEIGSAMSAPKQLLPRSSTAAENGTVFHLPPYASPFLFIPANLEVSFPTCSVVYVRHPTARPGYSEVPTPYDADGEVIRLAWEWYSRLRPRMRRKRDLWMSPDRTHGTWTML